MAVRLLDPSAFPASVSATTPHSLRVLDRFQAVRGELRTRGVSLAPDGEETHDAVDNRIGTELMALYRDTLNQRSFEALYAVTESSVLVWIRSLLARGGGGLDATELLQDTFVNVFRYPARLPREPPGQLPRVGSHDRGQHRPESAFNSPASNASVASRRGLGAGRSACDAGIERSGGRAGTRSQVRLDAVPTPLRRGVEAAEVTRSAGAALGRGRGPLVHRGGTNPERRALEHEDDHLRARASGSLARWPK